MRSFLGQKKAQGETLILANVGGLGSTSRVPSWAYYRIPAKGCVIISKPAPLYCVSALLCGTSIGCTFNGYAALCSALDAHSLTAIAVQQKMHAAINWRTASVAPDWGCGWHVFASWANNFKC
jgi:hypothetical protein